MMLEQPLRADTYKFENPNQRLLIRVLDTDRQFYNFKPGDVLIAREKGKPFYSVDAFYVDHLQTGRPLGSYFVSSFEIIGVFDTLEALQQYAQQEYDLEQSVVPLPQIEKERIDANGQLSLFDF